MGEPFTSPFEENFPGADIHSETWVFLKAIEQYQREHKRRYPTWREVLAVAHSLGYRRVAGASEEFEAWYRAAAESGGADDPRDGEPKRPGKRGATS